MLYVHFVNYAENSFISVTVGAIYCVFGYPHSGDENKMLN